MNEKETQQGPDTEWKAPDYPNSFHNVSDSELGIKEYVPPEFNQPTLEQDMAEIKELARLQAEDAQYIDEHGVEAFVQLLHDRKNDGSIEQTPLLSRHNYHPRTPEEAATIEAAEFAFLETNK